MISSKLASDVIESVKIRQRKSRSDWEKTYTDGLKYLGMKFDEARSQPFAGSSGVVHPILAESVTQFQAQAYKELLPAKGPVKTEIVGARSPEVEMQADRVSAVYELLHHEHHARVRPRNGYVVVLFTHWQALRLRKFISIPLKAEP